MLKAAKNSIMPLEAEYFTGGSVRTLGCRARPPYVDRPESRGSSRKLTEAKNNLGPLRIRIFPGNSALGLWVSAIGPLHGNAGRTRKLTEAKNIIRRPLESEYFLRGGTVWELWVAVPDPLRGHLETTGAHGISRKLKMA